MSTPTGRPTAPPPAPAREISRVSMAVAAFSTVVEWYDFTLYIYFATVLARVFFGGGGDSLGITLLGFAIAYLMRPVGAMVFGRIGDRYGRKRMMLLSMALMSAAMLATACLPTHAVLGAAAGWLLLVLRLLMAFSVGGEYTGVVAYLMEGAKDERRGLIASLASASSEIGGLLAVAVSTVTVATLSQGALDAWGWRIPFFVGAVLAAGVLVARSSMDESPDFEAQEERGSVPESPVLDTLRHHFPAVACTFCISALGSITYYVGITYVPAFLTDVGKFTEADSMMLSTVAAVAVILVTPLAGALSDRVGRKPAMLGFAIAALVLPLTMFSFMGRGTAWIALAGAVVLACVAGGVSAIAASQTPEQFPGEGRLSGLALGVTMATAIFGGLTPWAAHKLTALTGWSATPGAMIAVVALLVLPVLWTIPETAPAKVGERRPDEEHSRA